MPNKLAKSDFPEKKKVLDSYTHELEKLVKVANLEDELKSLKADPDFLALWLVVKQWSEESRYKKHNRQEATDIYLAITDPNHGVLQWLQQHW